MKWVTIAAIVIAVLAAGAGLWLYRGSVERQIADIEARLVSEAQLAQPNKAETLSAIKLAPIQCERVFDLRSNKIAYGFKGDQLDALWQHCQRIADIASGLDRIERQSPP
ncbi:MAG: hypothetical protein R6X03_12450 [Methyloceanibacter sp.]|jgi:hypothetical protein